MKAFADLYRRLDETTSTNRKIEAMVDYFQRTPAADAIWAVRFLIGRKPRQVIPTRKLKEWAARLAGTHPAALGQGQTLGRHGSGDLKPCDSPSIFQMNIIVWLPSMVVRQTFRDN